MKLTVDYNDRLPPLAWVAEVRQREERVSVRCGKWVETGRDFFIEGAWAGEYLAADFDRTECVFGSGAVIDEESVVFVSSVATTDYLYYRQQPAGVMVANSLPLLLAVIGDELDPACDNYGTINRSLLHGFRDHIAEIPTRTSSVQRLMHQNLRITRASVAIEAKPEPPRFGSFSEYLAYLEVECRSLLFNARAGERKTPLFVASTQSRGYDTTAVNAIAVKYGIDAVFTIANAKPFGTFSSERVVTLDDDGTEIAGRLGLENVVRLERNEFARMSDDDERLLYATLDDNGDANFFAICRHLPDRPTLLLTGSLGEIWYPERLYVEWRKPNSGAYLARCDLGTHGLTELRLQTGFIQAALIYLGARHRDDIFRLSDSAEMAPWSISGRYNRPIPRRIGEEAGIPRDWFGQQKMATVVEFPPPQIPRGSELRARYRSFLIRNRLISSLGWALMPLVHSWNTAVIFASPTKYRLFDYAGRLMRRFGKRDAQLPKLRRRLSGRLFCFAANERAAEYAGKLAASPVIPEPSNALIGR